MTKPLMIVTAILALLAVPAHAQMGGRRHQGGDKAEQEKP